MSTDLIVDAAHKQMAATDATMVAWRPREAGLAALVPYAETGIALFLDRPALMRRVVERILKIARSGHAANLLQLWSEGAALFHSALRAMADHRDLVTLLQQAGHAIEGAPAFEQTIRTLQQMRDEFRQTCPVATPEEVEADRQAIAAGQYQDAEEALAEIAGMDLATWRQRIEKAASRS